jgi:hypothetical protein
MELSLTTPALLFPAISLLLLAYTNRFLTLASLIRELHRSYHTSPEERNIISAQLANLRYRVSIIRSMQIFGVASFFGSVVSMIALFSGQEPLGRGVFGLSRLLLLGSLALSLREVQVSVDALNFRLSDLEGK